MTTVIGIFLILHGLVHTGLAAAPDPKDPESKPGRFFTTTDRSWLFQRLGVPEGAVKWIGIVLVALATLGFVAAGLGILDIFGLGAFTSSLVIPSAIVSLGLLAVFWHRWLAIGVLIDLGILAWWFLYPPGYISTA